MCLYGHDISTAQTPPMAALGWVVGKERRDESSPASKFNGSSVILAQLAETIQDNLPASNWSYH